MNIERRNALMLRRSLLTSILIGLYWLGFYLLKGSIPTISILDFGISSIEPPFAVSRLFDILIGPIGSVAIIWFYTETSNKGKPAKEKFVYGLVSGLVAAMMAGLVSGLVSELTPRLMYSLLGAMMAGLMLGAMVTLVYIPVYEPVSGLMFMKGCSISICLAIALYLGLPYGLVAGVVAGLILVVLKFLSNLILVENQN